MKKILIKALAFIIAIGCPSTVFATELHSEREVALSDVSTAYESKIGPIKYHVWADGVNLRSSPSTSAQILEKIYADEYVFSTTAPPEYYEDGTYTWIHVKREKTGTIGWIVDSYIDYDR